MIKKTRGNSYNEICNYQQQNIDKTDHIQTKNFVRGSDLFTEQKIMQFKNRKMNNISSDDLPVSFTKLLGCENSKALPFHIHITPLLAFLRFIYEF